MKISNIVIENVRGIEKLEISGMIHSNTPTFFVAPNGFGKTSIATAFDSLSRDKIILAEDQLHNENHILIPKISLTDDEVTLVANDEKNEITKKYDVFVIKGQVKPKATTQNYGSFSNSKASMIVEPIVLYNTIPEKAELSYSFSNMKSAFGPSAGKILINLSDKFSSHKFFNLFSNLTEQYSKMLGTKNKAKMEKLIEELNNHRMSKKQIIDGKFNIESLLSVKPFSHAFNELAAEMKESSNIEIIINLIQMIYVYEDNKNKFSKISKYKNFCFDKIEISRMLSFFNCTWKEIKAVKDGQKYILKFPNANTISNGERDILVFIGKMFEVRKKLNKQYNILVIDEIFDYLDEANLISAQYFLVKLINSYKSIGKEIFIVMLTHLDPLYFNTYSFSVKNVIYLEKAEQTRNKFNVNNLLKNRENCKKNTPEIYDNISKGYFHYCNLTIDESTYISKLGCDASICTRIGFYEKADEELSNYIKGNDYDIALVCSGIRLKIEKNIFDKLPEKAREEYVNTFKTINKLNYAKKCDVDIPEIYYLLSIIYNEGMHLDDQCKKLIPIEIKLRNKVIRSMITKI